MKKNKILLVSIFIMISFSFIMCSDKSFYVSSFYDLIIEAKSKVSYISIKKAKLLFSKKQVKIIDCREPGEFKKGHLPFAINVPRGVIEKMINKVPNVSKNSKMVLYCKKSGRSTLSAYNLKRLGYKNVKVMKGGFTEWKKALHPIEMDYKGKIFIPRY